MTPSELDEIWCVGSPGGHMYPKGISPQLLIWLPRNGLYIKYFTFCHFCSTRDHSNHHNLGIFYSFEKRILPL